MLFSLLIFFCSFTNVSDDLNNIRQFFLTEQLRYTIWFIEGSFQNSLRTFHITIDGYIINDGLDKLNLLCIQRIAVNELGKCFLCCLFIQLGNMADSQTERLVLIESLIVFLASQFLREYSFQILVIFLRKRLVMNQFAYGIDIIDMRREVPIDSFLVRFKRFGPYNASPREIPEFASFILEICHNRRFGVIGDKFNQVSQFDSYFFKLKCIRFAPEFTCLQFVKQLDFLLNKTDMRDFNSCTIHRIWDFILL